MKLTDIVLEAPMRIPPLDDNALNDPTANHERYTLFTKLKTKKHIATVNGVDLYTLQLGSEEIIVGLYPATEQVMYYCNYEVKTEPNAGRTCTQIMVWSSKSSRVKEIPRMVFFRFLMKKYKTMQTDTMHTPDGERFWLSNIRTAFEVGYNVYSYNNANHNLRLINNYKEFTQYYLTGSVWGGEFEHADETILISSKELKSS